MCQIRTVPVAISTARTPCTRARTTSVLTITNWRGNRSAMTPPTSTKTTSGAE